MNNFEEYYNQLYDDYIGNRADIDDEIKEVSEYVATKLLHGDKKIWCEFQDDIYEFRLSQGFKDWKDRYLLVAVRYPDLDKKDNGILYKIEIAKDKNLTAQENLTAGVAALFQHILGIIQPEELSDG